MKVPQLHVGAGSRLGPLSIFPVWTSGSGSLGISTGTHADVAVTELAGGAQVARLTVTNNGPHPALLLEGELLEGGQQHRTCARDVVLGPGETRDIDTFCVEAGRWEAGETSHRRQARRAPLNVWSELANGLGRRARRQPAGPHLGAGQPLRRRPRRLRDQLPARAHGPVQGRRRSATASTPRTHRHRWKASAAS